MKLDAHDERVLALLGTRPRSVSTLAAALDEPPRELAAQLGELADNGLVADLGDGRYRRTESGRRVLRTSAGVVDERIDTTPEIEEALEALDLRPDEADAVRHAFAFLRYWGRATEAELVDAIYAEVPAGRNSPGEWWDEVVRDPLADLPTVEPATGDDAWRYTGTPEIAEPDSDGRRVLSRTHPVYGDVKHALESLSLSADEREAVRAAFTVLYRRGTATESDVRETIYPAFDAGYASPENWWDDVIEAGFAVLPGVERVDDDTWRYRRQ